MTQVSKHYAILGGGLSGRLMAWRLLEQGMTVTIFDRDLSGKLSAGAVAAAMIAPLSEALDGLDVLYLQGRQGLAIWDRWIKSINAEQAQPVDFSIKGSIFVSHDQDKLLYTHLMQKLQQSAVISTDDYHSVNHEALQRLEPDLAKNFKAGCLLKAEGYLDNNALLKALGMRIDQLGGHWQQRMLPGTLAAVKALPGFNAYPHIIDCRGLGARHELNDLRGVRGEVLRVQAKEVNLSRPVRLMHPRYKLYVVPRPDNIYVIGATQIESDSEAPITVRSSLELLSALYSLHPGFAEAHILSQEAKCRPAFNDNLPQIRVKQGDLILNGLYRHGYLLAPAVITQAMHRLGLESESPWPDIVKTNPGSACSPGLTQASITVPVNGH